MNTVYTTRGTRTVVTNEQNGHFSSRLYVNCRHIGNGHMELGEATLVACKHTTAKGARAWALKRVAE